MTTAVVLYNLGGPDKPDDIKPFLFNLFNDPMIFGLPQPFRWMLAKLVSSRRDKTAREIYAHLGGGSRCFRIRVIRPTHWKLLSISRVKRPIAALLPCGTGIRSAMKH